MINMEWKEPNGQYRHTNLLTDMLVEDCVESLMKRGCKNIKIEYIER